jgi:hypothetical protein
MPSYRRHVARHPLALARALRAVRAHAMQTGPQDPNHWSVHTPVDPFELMCGGPAPVVAHAYRGYLHSDILRCMSHPLPPHAETIELTSEDLPDGGICTWPECGRDVLA